jgi:hypothetical protein
MKADAVPAIRGGSGYGSAREPASAGGNALVMPWQAPAFNLSLRRRTKCYSWETTSLPPRVDNANRVGLSIC